MSSEAQPPYPIPRRAHQKSRTGCKNCKQRKVKCDEKRPVCDKCAIHYANIQKCDYGDHSPTADEPAPTRPAAEKLRRTSRTVPILPKSRQQHRSADALVLARAGSSTFDPFTQHPPSLEPDINLLMGTYFSSHIFNVFPYYPTPTLNPVLEFFAPLVTKDVALFHVTLLVSAFRLEQHLSPRERVRCIRLSKICMDLIQNRINEPFPDCVSDETLAAVAGVAVVEHEKGSLRLSRIHVTGLKQMLEVRGGLAAIRISNPTVANMLFCMFVATADVEFPSCDAQTVIQRPPWFYQSLRLHRSLLGTGVELPNPMPIDFQAHGVLTEYSELMLNIRMLAMTYQTAQDCSSAREYQEVLTFLCATLQRLLTLPVPDLLLGSYESTITAACRHALIIHVFAQWCGHQPDPSLVVSTAQHNLLATLRPLTEQSGASTKLLLWLLSVGGTCPFGPAQHKWFISQLADTAADLEIHSWEGMKLASNRLYGTSTRMTKNTESCGMRWSNLERAERFTFPRWSIQYLLAGERTRKVELATVDGVGRATSVESASKHD
ncbi:Fungal specific transcription factor domain-containing protein [Cladophialophora immunda]|nr:Fungal specific transcription factor domain-containing protein [Cladophialophora immunda]